MSLGNIQVLSPGAFGSIGAKKQNVAAGTTSSIKAGELVLKALGAVAVTAWGAGVNTKPVVGTDFLAGLATSTSTETASLAGTVDVMPIVQGVQYLIAPTVLASWDTQAEYDALVGKRVLLDSSAGSVQTILAADGATFGLVVEPLNIALFPGKVCFSLRQALSYQS